MSIINIKSALLRRTLLVLLTVPLIIVACVWNAVLAIAEVLVDVPEVTVNVWRGRQ